MYAGNFSYHTLVCIYFKIYLPILQGRNLFVPKQLAELILLAANIWMNPMVFDSSEEDSYCKFMILSQMLQGFGLDIIDTEILERLQELVSIYQKSKK